MRISELYIESFGGISNRRFGFADGINLITGSNESGKSTVASFLCYLFYGFSDRKEKKLLSDIKTGVSSGSAVFETDGGEHYRITRREKQEGKSSVEVFTDTGAPYDGWQSSPTPGDHFFGVPLTLFVRSAFVSQRDGIALADGSSEALRNLMLTATEVGELQRALKKLDERRVELLHKNGKGGRIFELENEIDEQERLLESCAERRELARSSSAEIAADEALLDGIMSKLSGLETDVSGRRELVVRELLTEKKRLEQQCGENEQRSFELELEFKNSDFLPNEEYLNSLREAENAVLVAEREVESCRARMYSPETSGVAFIRDQGGIEAVQSRVRRLGGAFKRSLVACAVALVACIGMLATALNLGKLPLYLVFAASLVAFVIALGCSMNARMKMSALLTSLSVRSKAELSRLCEQYETNARRADEASRALEVAEEKRAEAISVRAELLERWGKNSVSSAFADAERYLSSNVTLESMKNVIKQRLQINRAKLDAYSPEEIKMAEERMASGETPEVRDTETPLSELEIKKRRLETERQETETRLSDKRIQHAERFSELPEISAVTQRLDALKAEKQRLCDVYNAAKLAYDSLKNADSELRKRIAPYLSDTAGQVFSLVTEGRYEGLGVDGEASLRLSCLLDGAYLPSEYLSAGASALAWLCLRLAIYTRVSETERLPLILDECFVCLDDGRLGRMLERLSSIADNGSQILLFSANSREKDIYGTAVNVIDLDADR